MQERNENQFMIIGECDIIYYGGERTAKKIWYQIITGNLQLFYDGKIRLVEVIAENKLPISRGAEDE